MVVTIKEVVKFLESFDNFLREPVRIGLIGGAAMLVLGIKESTKDIDLVFFTGGDLQESKEFLDIYSRGNRIEIQYGFCGRFQSMLMNEDMFRHSKEITLLKESFLHKYRLKNLDICILEPAYFILAKIEAAASKGTAHFEDAMKVARHFGVKKEELIKAYEEYRPEIEVIQRMVVEFNMFIQDFYGERDFDIKKRLRFK